MVRFFLPLAIAATLLPAAAAAKRPPAQPRYELHEGDIVFQGNPGAQSDAIRDATGSPFTHCGVVFRHEGRWMVVEAVQPVGTTPLDHWIARSLPDTFRAYRLKQPPGPDAGRRGSWDDGALYCSEFVWKLYQQAGIELCKQRPFRDYKLDAPTVKAIIAPGGMCTRLPLDTGCSTPSKDTLMCPGSGHCKSGSESINAFHSPWAVGLSWPSGVCRRM